MTSARRADYDALRVALAGTEGETSLLTFAAERGYAPDDPIWEGAAPALIAGAVVRAEREKLEAAAARLEAAALMLHGSSPAGATAFDAVIEALPDDAANEVVRYQRKLGSAVPKSDRVWYGLGAAAPLIADALRLNEKTLAADVLLRRDMVAQSESLTVAKQLTEALGKDVRAGDELRGAIVAGGRAVWLIAIVTGIVAAALALGLAKYAYGLGDASAFARSFCSTEAGLAWQARHDKHLVVANYVLRDAYSRGCR